MEKRMNQIGLNLVVGSFGFLRIYDFNTFELKQEIKAKENWFINVVEVVSKYILIGDSNSELFILNTEPNRKEKFEIVKSFQIYENNFSGIKAITKLGEKNFVLGSNDKEAIKIYDLSFTCLLKISFKGKNQNVGATDVSTLLFNEREFLLICGCGRSLFMWDLRKYFNEKMKLRKEVSEKKVLPIKILNNFFSDSSAISCLIQRKKDSTLISSYHDYSLVLWDLQKFEIIKVREGKGFNYVLTKIVFVNEKEDIFASSDSHGSIRLWNLNLECIKTFKIKKAGGIYSMINFDEYLVYGGSDFLVQKWEKGSSWEEGESDLQWKLIQKFNNSEEVWCMCAFRQKNYFESVDKNRRIEKILKDEDLFDISFEFVNKRIRCFKCLLSLSELNLGSIDKISFNHSVNLKEKDIFLLLLGEKVSFESGDVFLDYFIFFNCLKMKGHQLLILQLYNEHDFGMKEKLDLFLKSFKMFKEKVDSESETFFSVFNLNLFNVLKEEENELTSRPENVFLFRDHLLRLKKFRQKNVFEEHEDFLPLLNDFSYISIKYLAKLGREAVYNNQKHSDVKLIIDEKQHFVNSHKLILMSFSNFFFFLFSFKGRDLISKNEMKIEVLNFLELKAYCKYLYLREHNEELSIESIFRLIDHSEAFFESEMRLFFMEIIKRKFSKFFKEDVFFQKYIEYSNLIGLLPKHLQDTLYDYIFFKYGLTKTSLQNLKEFFEKTRTNKTVKKKVFI